MRIILGLGNPGKKYENTRHNIGFTILDEIARKESLVFCASKYEYYITGSPKKASPFYLIKPTTYINLSGIAASQTLKEYSIASQELLVISDDVNLPPGKIRIRKSGGDGGHNGLNSIIYHLNTDQFPRLRFGIGSDFDDGKMAEYVLDKFSEKDFKDIQESISFSIKLIFDFIEGGIENMLASFSKINNNRVQVSNIDKIEGN